MPTSFTGTESSASILSTTPARALPSIFVTASPVRPIASWNTFTCCAEFCPTCASSARRLHGIEGDSPRVGAGLVRDNLDLGPLSPEAQLLDRRGAIGVGGGQQRAVAFPTQQLRQLSNRRRLARSVDADD